MKKLTGQQRAAIIIVWIKRGRDMDKESFVRKVCKLKSIEYVPPVKVDR